MHILMEGLSQYSIDGSEFEKIVRKKAIDRHFPCYREKSIV